MLLRKSGIKDGAMPDYRAVYGDHVVVVGTAPTVTLEEYAKFADRAVLQVDDVMGSPLGEPVLVAAPASDAEFREIAGYPPRGVYTTITNPGHVPFVLLDTNPSGPLYSTELQQLLTHEMVHVWSMQRSARRPPDWLREGFADVVSTQAIDGELYATKAWLTFHPGAELPAAVDFRKTPQRAYFLSWSLCHYIADRWGMTTLIRLHADQLEHGKGDLAGSLRRVLHTDAEHLHDGWARWYATQAAHRR